MESFNIVIFTLSRCIDGDSFEVWTDDTNVVTLGFADLGCRAQPLDSNLAMGTCGPNNEGTLVDIGDHCTDQGYIQTTCDISCIRF